MTWRMEWFELKIFSPASHKEALTNRLFEMGAQGVTEEEKSKNTDDSIKAFFTHDLREGLESEIDAYLGSLAEIFPEVPALRYEITDVKMENWADRYKEFYKPQRLTNRFFLQPKWNIDASFPSGMIPIVMDPGQAFGTGLHASTRLCVKMIQHAIDSYVSAKKISLLDVGTGTGILAIAAEKLRVGRVVAIDNDPLAVEVAIENCEGNGCHGIELSDTPLENIPEMFDIVVANILLETHRELFRYYVDRLNPRGQLILSGVLGSNYRELKELLAGHGFRVEISSHLQEWVAVMAVRNS
jgi:ribosomal protein L11 methyltransferase